jgi:hypothetical protein
MLLVVVQGAQGDRFAAGMYAGAVGGLTAPTVMSTGLIERCCQREQGRGCYGGLSQVPQV